MERLGAVADFQNLYYNMSENQEKIRGPKELDRTISIFPDRALKFVWRGAPERPALAFCRNRRGRQGNTCRKCRFGGGIVRKSKKTLQLLNTGSENFDAILTEKVCKMISEHL